MDVCLYFLRLEITFLAHSRRASNVSSFAGSPSGSNGETGIVQFSVLEGKGFNSTHKILMQVRTYAVLRSNRILFTDEFRSKKKLYDTKSVKAAEPSW